MSDPLEAASREKAGRLIEFIVGTHEGDLKAAVEACYAAGERTWAVWAVMADVEEPSIFTQDRVITILEAMANPKAQDPFEGLDNQPPAR